ncbi:MAG: hypothetical protein ACE5PT_13115 [Gemmatimonadales bacterium]
MNKLIVATLVAGAVGLLPNPTPADAQDDRLLGCLKEAIASCDEDFSGNSLYTIAIRGWCYAIRSGMCYALDPH